MFTSFFLLAIIAVLYYFDAKRDILIQANMKMQQVVSQLRQNPNIHPKGFDIYIDKAQKYHFPAFTITDKHIEYVACANKFFPNKVFVVKTSADFIKNEQKKILYKIAFMYILLFFPFLLVSYFLAKYAIKPAKEAYSAIYGFTQDIIHDMKTPVTTISLNSELLQCSNQKSLKRLNIAVDTLKALYQNLEQFMLFQKSFHPQKFNLKKLVDSRIEYLHSMNQNANFFVDIPLKLELYTDKMMFTRILDNLLINAMKYSTPTIDIKIMYENGKLSIENPGEPIKNPQKLFERHYREALYVPGFGLGMNIVKKLLDKLEINLYFFAKKNATKISLEIEHLQK